VIALVRGEVAVRREDHVVVLCGGVGYRLAVSAQTLARVPSAGSETSLHAHLIARDDGLHLYGFASEQERDLFLMLLSVQAVGPKVALAALSGAPAGELMSAIAGGDTKRFLAVPGIGKRTAERIVMELREKVGADAGWEGSDSAIVIHRGEDSPRRLARDGLLELGFAPAEAERLIEDASGETAEELLAAALRAARSGSER
jgi:Holliday junction DNA helicase RuvA